MTQTKHTLGLWRVCAPELNKGAVAAIDKDGNIAGLISICPPPEQWPSYGHITTDDTMAANARLIAAAPELLQVAKHALADLDGIMPEYEPSGDRGYPAWSTIAELRAAIAKAEGGQS